MRGRVLEVTDDAQPRIVWEYFNIAGRWSTGSRRVGLITHAERFRPEDLTFLPAPVVNLCRRPTPEMRACAI